MTPLADPSLPAGLPTVALVPTAPRQTDAQLYAQLRLAFKRLPRRLRLILAYRHGMLDGTHLTLAATGQQLGIGEERVRQLQNQAVSQMLREVLGPHCAGDRGLRRWLAESLNAMRVEAE